MSEAAETVKPSVRELVLKLVEAGFSPQTISDAMEKRVSSRTIYRWARGESAPQNEMDLKVLLDLVAEKCPS
jgi:IS30 family transposase